MTDRTPDEIRTGAENFRPRDQIGLREVPDLRLSAMRCATRFRDVWAHAVATQRAPDGPAPRRRAWGGIWADNMLDHLAKARLWWVADDMVDLMEAAAPSMPAQPLHPDDLPDNQGLVFFARPLGGIFDETTTEAMPPSTSRPEAVIGALLWAKVDVYRPDGSGPPNGGVDLEFLSVVDVAGYGLMIAPLGGCTWMFGRSAAEGNESATQDMRRAVALWTLSQQERLVDSRDESMSRPAAKRSTRAKADASDLRVVRLRRARREAGDPAGSGVEWSHRWVVSGHWRNQYLPSRGTHRVQWISPHVKGPGDKPLVVKETVTAWTS
jgi:hypothetical protein